MANSNSIQILLNVLDITPLIDYESVKVDNNIVMTADVMNFTMKLNGNETVYDTVAKKNINATRPKAGQEIVWQNPANIVTAPNGSKVPYREFGGVVVEVRETVEGTSLQYEVSCKSYVHWLDRHLVTAWYQEQEPSAVVSQIVKQSAPGFTTYNVRKSNTTVIPQYFDYRKVSDSIKSVADQIEWGWYVDYYKDVHFYSFETFTSPLPNNTLDVDKDLVNYGDLTLTENIQQQMNKIFIKGFKTRSAEKYSLKFQGDGTTEQWSLGYRVSSVSGDVDVVVYDSEYQYNLDTSFQNGGQNNYGEKMALKKDIIDGAPNRGNTSNTCFIHYTQHLIRIPNYRNNGPVPPGKLIVVRFNYLRDMVWLAQDQRSQRDTKAIEGVGDGVYEAVFSDKSLTNSTLNAVKAKGELLLSKYRAAQITGSFNAYKTTTTTSGWVAGQYFRLLSTKRLGGIDEYMFVQRVSKQIIKNDQQALVVYYTVEFADSPYLV
ncbi:hypothetical protein HB667_26795 [Bacillus cereus]|uniref:hypothetical protein n=1 Tax=Bacillus cereus group TaxID=86661 RepID=UPI0014440ACB|nr:hypothetical protein [Bacillus cereus]NKW77423.1 hypothetical protein [Bacillus cereus]NKX14841.1 hypothetical protein [Bacillus cereus]